MLNRAVAAELAGKLMESAMRLEDPQWSMAERISDSVMEAEEGWGQFFKGLRERDLVGVSDARKAVLVQRDEDSAKAKATELGRQFWGRGAKAMEILGAGIEEVLSYLHQPPPHRRRLSSNNLIENLRQEIRRCVVGIFPRRCARLRPIGMLLVEIQEKWLPDDKACRSFDHAPAEEPAAKLMSMMTDQ